MKRAVLFRTRGRAEAAGRHLAGSRPDWIQAFRAKREQPTYFKEFRLTAKARIWPQLSYLCHIRSTAEQPLRSSHTIGVSLTGSLTGAGCREEQLEAFQELLRGQLTTC